MNAEFGRDFAGMEAKVARDPVPFLWRGIDLRFRTGYACNRCRESER
jgi:hypothetical protein